MVAGGQGNRVKHSGQDGGRREDPNLERYVQCGGQANCHKPTNPGQMRTERTCGRKPVFSRKNSW